MVCRPMSACCVKQFK